MTEFNFSFAFFAGLHSIFKSTLKYRKMLFLGNNHTCHVFNSRLVVEKCTSSTADLWCIQCHVNLWTQHAPQISCQTCAIFHCQISGLHSDPNAFLQWSFALSPNPNKRPAVPCHACAVLRVSTVLTPSVRPTGPLMCNSLLNERRRRNPKPVLNLLSFLLIRSLVRRLKKGSVFPLWHDKGDRRGPIQQMFKKGSPRLRDSMFWLP